MPREIPLELEQDAMKRLAEFLGVDADWLIEDYFQNDLTVAEFANLRLWGMSPCKVDRILRGEPEPDGAEEHERLFREQLARL
jgi:hypothetical protein